ncbi:uncharacterized protein V6R79_004276 [Siganus canaliculatus]
MNGHRRCREGGGGRRRGEADPAADNKLRVPAKHLTYGNGGHNLHPQSTAFRRDGVIPAEGAERLSCEAPLQFSPVSTADFKASSASVLLLSSDNGHPSRRLFIPPASNGSAEHVSRLAPRVTSEAEDNVPPSRAQPGGDKAQRGPCCQRERTDPPLLPPPPLSFPPSPPAFLLTLQLYDCSNALQMKRGANPPEIIDKSSPRGVGETSTPPPPSTEDDMEALQHLSMKQVWRVKAFNSFKRNFGGASTQQQQTSCRSTPSAISNISLRRLSPAFNPLPSIAPLRRALTAR